MKKDTVALAGGDSPLSTKIRKDVAVPGSRSHGDHRPFTAISVILQHAAILNTYCGVETYEYETYDGKDSGRETGSRGSNRKRNRMRGKEWKRNSKRVTEKGQTKINEEKIR